MMRQDGCRLVSVTSLLQSFLLTIVDDVQHLEMNQQLGWIWWTGWNAVFVWNVAIGYIPPDRQFALAGHSGSMLCLWHSL